MRLLPPLAGLLCLPFLAGAAPGQPPAGRVARLFQQLTPAEKLSLLSGHGYATTAIPRLGLPALNMVDAGQGARGGSSGTIGPATAFPAGVALAATWDVGLLHRVGRAIGEEVRNKGDGAQLLLGPAVNIHRSPLGGRNSEFFSEDPFLTSRLAVGFIRGVQATGVGACIKHFACNNEESDRDYVDVKVGERALREIYLPAFEAAVKQGHVRAVMSSHNRVNGSYTSANAHLLTDILKKEWGFDGLLMSDWGGVHDIAAVQAGTDLEMPFGYTASPDRLRAALAEKLVTRPAINRAVRRILRTMARVGLLGRPLRKYPSVVNSPAHRQLAFQAAAESIVLLKNDRAVLPLDRSRVRSIAVIGSAARALQIGALGSAEVKPLRTVEILAGLQAAAGGIPVRFAEGDLFGQVITGAEVSGQPGAPGFLAEYFLNREFSGPPILARVEDQIQFDTLQSIAPGVPATDYAVRWTARLTAPETGLCRLAFTGDDGFRVYLDGALRFERWSSGYASTRFADVALEAGSAHDLRVEYYQQGGKAVGRLSWKLPSAVPYADAVAAARQSDVAVVCVSSHGQEGAGIDRVSMDLPDQQDELIEAVARANPRTIVVLNNGAPVITKNWIGQVPAALEAWFPGQEGGAAIAAVLFGDVNPSGKLPDTFAQNREDYPDYGNFPGRNEQVRYAEGIYVGYRHFDRRALAPVFPFGHGLSYTTFVYGNLQLSHPRLRKGETVSAKVVVTNAGARAGDEIVQLYVQALRPQVDRPMRELKGFARVSLQPGETKVVRIPISPRDLAYFDVVGAQWKADPGSYRIQVGASSRDLRLAAPLRLIQAFTEEASAP